MDSKRIRLKREKAGLGLFYSSAPPDRDSFTASLSLPWLDLVVSY
jgi:hypothetical protein